MCTSFQFQYGAIESNMGKAALLILSMFQFQYGAIESVRRDEVCPIREKVSIPVWCD